MSELFRMLGRALAPSNAVLDEPAPFEACKGEGTVWTHRMDPQDDIELPAKRPAYAPGSYPEWKCVHCGWLNTIDGDCFACKRTPLSETCPECRVYSERGRAHRLEPPCSRLTVTVTGEA